jgi:hypothetical protein
VNDILGFHLNASRSWEKEWLLWLGFSRFHDYWFDQQISSLLWQPDTGLFRIWNHLIIHLIIPFAYIASQIFSKQWKDNWTFWSLDNYDWMAWRTVRFWKQWKDNGTFWSMYHDWMAWRTVRFSKQWKDNYGTFWSLDRDWMTWRTVGFSTQWKHNGTFWSLDCD